MTIKPKTPLIPTLLFLTEIIKKTHLKNLGENNLTEYLNQNNL